MNYENLSREDLIKLLNKDKKTEDPWDDTEFPYGTCNFVPTRGKRKKCIRAATSAHGFCSTHNSTVQARNVIKNKEPKEEPKNSPKRERKEKKKEERKETHTHSICLRKNQWGHFEHRKTGIVFDPLTKKACGIQTTTGKVYPLTEEHIQICEQYGWEYYIPGTKKDSSDDEEELNKTEEITSDEEESEEESD